MPRCTLARLICWPAATMPWLPHTQTQCSATYQSYRIHQIFPQKYIVWNVICEMIYVCHIAFSTAAFTTCHIVIPILLDLFKRHIGSFNVCLHFTNQNISSSEKLLSNFIPFSNIHHISLFLVLLISFATKASVPSNLSSDIFILVCHIKTYHWNLQGC